MVHRSVTSRQIFSKPTVKISRAFSVKCHASTTNTYELRICTNRTCKSQGSQQIAQFGKDLNLAEVEVTTCGCLGNCGMGPNAVLFSTSPPSSLSSKTATNTDEPMIINHIGTPARLVDLINTLCGVQVDANILKATELRLAGNAAARDGNSQRAIQLFSEAIDLNPSRGKHLLLSNRSGTRLALKDAQGALEDAVAAVECAPAEFTTAAVRLADALFALGRYSESLEALDAGADRHPLFRNNADYKMLRGHILKAVQQQQKIKA